MIIPWGESRVYPLRGTYGALTLPIGTNVSLFSIISHQWTKIDCSKYLNLFFPQEITKKKTVLTVTPGLQSFRFLVHPWPKVDDSKSNNFRFFFRNYYPPKKVWLHLPSFLIYISFRLLVYPRTKITGAKSWMKCNFFSSGNISRKKVRNNSRWGLNSLFNCNLVNELKFNFQFCAFNLHLFLSWVL